MNTDSLAAERRDNIDARALRCDATYGSLPMGEGAPSFSAQAHFMALAKDRTASAS
jgi:hypothetical protein